jgi:hypothetical protein
MKRKHVTFFLVLCMVLVAYLVYQRRDGFDVLTDPYVPPLKTDFYQPCVRINVETRGVPQEYGQVGLLTRGDTILPLMGRRLYSDKWQYYSISNTGVVNTKLPLRFKGRSCTSEYGCEALSTGDSVYVEGYKQSFGVTLYETAQLQYLPLHIPI